MALCGWRCQRQFSCQSRCCAALGQSRTCSAPGFIWDLGSGLPLRPVGWVVAVLFRGPHMHRGKRKGLVLTQNFRVTFLALPSSPPHSLSSPQSLHFSVPWTRKMGFPSEFQLLRTQLQEKRGGESQAVHCLAGFFSLSLDSPSSSVDF